MRYGLIAVIVFTTMILQATVLPLIRIMGHWADVLTILVICYGLYLGSTKGAIIGFLTGLIQDIVYGFPIGISAISKGLIGFASGFGEDKFNKDFPLIPIPFVFIGTFVHDFIYLLSHKLTGVQVEVFRTLFQEGIPLLLLNAFIAPIVFVIVKRTNLWVDKRMKTLKI